MTKTSEDTLDYPSKSNIMDRSSPSEQGEPYIQMHQKNCKEILTRGTNVFIHTILGVMYERNS